MSTPRGVSLPGIDQPVPVRWGWFAIALGIMKGQWITPGEAALIVRADPHHLAYWARQGLISTVHKGPRRHHLYLQEELEAIACLTAKSWRPSTPMLKQLVQETI